VSRKGVAANSVEILLLGPEVGALPGFSRKPERYPEALLAEVLA
jgi:hypothetical protein